MRPKITKNNKNYVKEMSKIFDCEINLNLDNIHYSISKKKFGKGYNIYDNKNKKFVIDPGIHLLLDKILEYRKEYKNYIVYNLPDHIFFMNKDLRTGVEYIRYKAENYRLDQNCDWNKFIPEKLKELNKN